MLVVKIELHSAVTGEVTEIGRMIVHNIGTTPDGTRGDYSVCVGRAARRFDNDKVLKNPRRRGLVLHYPRLSYDVWRLIARSILAAFPEERGR